MDPIPVINCINGSCPESLVGGGGGENRTLEPGTDTIVSIRLEVTDLAGHPVRQVAIGEPFLVHVFASDHREVPRGVMAAFLDLQFSGAGLRRIGELQFPDDGNFLRRGALQRGEIDEVGAIFRLAPTTGGPQRVVTAVFEATRAGVAHFAADPADTLPLHHVLVFDIDEPVPIERISFGSLQLLVQPIPFVGADSVSGDTDPVAASLHVPLPDAVASEADEIAAQSTGASRVDRVLATPDDLADDADQDELLEYLAADLVAVSAAFALDAN